MLDALVQNSKEIVDVIQPEIYKYKFEEGPQDRIEGNTSTMFSAFGMKVMVFRKEIVYQMVIIMKTGWWKIMKTGL